MKRKTIKLEVELGVNLYNWKMKYGERDTTDEIREYLQESVEEIVKNLITLRGLDITVTVR